MQEANLSALAAVVWPWTSVDGKHGAKRHGQNSELVSILGAHAMSARFASRGRGGANGHFVKKATRLRWQPARQTRGIHDCVARQPFALSSLRYWRLIRVIRSGFLVADLSKPYRDLKFTMANEYVQRLTETTLCSTI